MAVDEGSRQLGLEIYQILREARAHAKKETRDEFRYPFFRPVAIDVGKFRLTGFSREVSETGIGLLHNGYLIPGEAEITIPTEQGYSVQIRTQIVWCTPCGQDWYISGGKFLGISRIGI